MHKVIEFLKSNYKTILKVGFERAADIYSGAKKTDIDIDEKFELYMKFKGVLIKISDEVLCNINNDTKFNVEFVLNHHETTEANKSLMVFERDSEYKLKSTDKILSSSAIIMIPID